MPLPTELNPAAWSVTLPWRVWCLPWGPRDPPANGIPFGNPVASFAAVGKGSQHRRTRAGPEHFDVEAVRRGDPRQARSERRAAPSINSGPIRLLHAFVATPGPEPRVGLGGASPVAIGVAARIRRSVHRGLELTAVSGDDRFSRARPGSSTDARAAPSELPVAERCSRLLTRLRLRGTRARRDGTPGGSTARF